MYFHIKKLHLSLISLNMFFFRFFRKTSSFSISFENPTVFPLALMRDFSKTHQSSLTLKGGSTSHLGLLPSGKKRKPLLSIVFTTPSVPLIGDRNVARNHFILWLADHQRSSPAAELHFAVCDRMDTNRLRTAEKPRSS